MCRQLFCSHPRPFKAAAFFLQVAHALNLRGAMAKSRGIQGSHNCILEVVWNDFPPNMSYVRRVMLCC